MSPRKPHIRPKSDPNRQQTEPAQHDAPPYTEWDPPVFTERDGAAELAAAERVLFFEDDCLR